MTTMDEQYLGRTLVNVKAGTENSGDVFITTENTSQNRQVEILEVEDEDARAQRLQSIFEKLNSDSDSPSGVPRLEMPKFQFDFGERKTWAVQPSELLSRVQAFLPQMEASNAVLTQRVEVDPQSVDIEQLEDNSEQYIEMNLGLGVFDMRPQGDFADDQDTEMTDSSSASSSSLSSSSSSSFTSSSSSNSDSEDTESELDSEEILSSCIPSSFLSRSPSSTSESFESTRSAGKMKAPRLMRPLPRRSGTSASQPMPSIIVLKETLNDLPME